MKISERRGENDFKNDGGGFPRRYFQRRGGSGNFRGDGARLIGGLSPRPHYVPPFL